MSPNTPKLRNDPLPQSGYLVLRGLGIREATVRNLAAEFLARFPGLHAYGLSGYYAVTTQDIDALCGDKMQRWERVAIFRIEDLRASGLGLHPTFRTPHITITHPDLDQLIDLLDHTDHKVVPNPYHGTND